MRLSTVLLAGASKLDAGCSYRIVVAGVCNADEQHKGEGFGGERHFCCV